MKQEKWVEKDFEEVDCFRCGTKGKLLYKKELWGVVKCEKCGQVFISPRLTEEGRKKIYEDHSYFDTGVYGFSNKFNLAMSLQRTWSNDRLNLISELLNNNIENKKLLEIGCAYGLFLNFAKQKGLDVTGIEYSSTAVKWSKENLQLNVHNGEIETIKLPENTYDVVCFWDVIEHVKNPELFLKSVRRVLKKDGVIVFSCPYFNSVPATVFKSNWWTLRPEQHIWQFTPDTLGKLFGEQGMKLVKVIRNPLSRINLFRFDSITVAAKVV
ncbi:MAG: class I SAM-dependent methyltransferase [bacterium]|nr:class I SAM-dependent methyltransferase [bacterium]